MLLAPSSSPNGAMNPAGPVSPWLSGVVYFFFEFVASNLPRVCVRARLQLACCVHARINPVVSSSGGEIIQR